MDMDDEMRRLKWLLLAGLILIVSAFFSWRELKYAVLGSTVDARLVRTYETTEGGRRGRSREKIAVEYEFTDKDGTVRKETDTISTSEPRPAGPTVLVQYRSGSPDASRLSGNSQRIWLLVFLGCIAFVGFKIWSIMKESKS
jgi:hypothetical protein